MEFEIARLANGIRLVHQPIQSPIAHACILIEAGSRDEEPTKFGLAHFIEHLLFKKTEKRSTAQILNRLESVGADLNAYTTKEYTCIHASFLKPYLGRTLDLFEDLLFHSEFPADELVKEKGIIMDEIASYRDSPEDAIMDDFEDLIFEGHGLGHNILGVEKDLLDMTQEDILRFIKKQYVGRQLVIGTSGPYSLKEVIRVVEKYFGHWTFSEASTQSKILTPPRAVPIEKTVRLPINQVHQVLGARTFSIHADEKFNLLLLNNMLGGMGMSSRLNLVVREQHGIAYTIESNYHPFADTGLFSVYFGTDEDKYEKARKLIQKEFKKLRDQKISSSSLQQAKKKYKGQIALGEENRLSLIIAQAKSLLDHDRIQTLSEIFGKIDAVTAESLLETANQVLDPEQFFTLTFLPE
jgi:predicted Zn-dependent peptidase